MSHQAIAILKELQPLTGRGNYVFPSGRSPLRPMSDNAVLSALGQAYNRTQYLPERKEMMQRWADYLDELRKTAQESLLPTLPSPLLQ